MNHFIFVAKFDVSFTTKKARREIRMKMTNCADCYYDSSNILFLFDLIRKKLEMNGRRVCLCVAGRDDRKQERIEIFPFLLLPLLSLLFNWLSYCCWIIACIRWLLLPRKYIESVCSCNKFIAMAESVGKRMFGEVFDVLIGLVSLRTACAFQQTEA